jgi:hypothetical protein
METQIITKEYYRGSEFDKNSTGAFDTGGVSEFGGAPAQPAQPFDITNNIM